jgi:molybdate transport repressor ModE-like protein
MNFSSGIVDALDPLRLRLLVEVERTGSISAAAEACRVGQPSATKHLKTLEAAVGEKLIERNGRASGLTEAGRLVSSHAVRVLDTLDAMQEELRALREAERGTLMLAASTTPGTYVLPSILQCFADRHPRVDVDVVIGSSTWVAGLVARRDVSLGLAGEVDLPAGVVAEPFLEDEVIGIAAPDQLKLRRGRASLANVASQTLLVREPGSSTRAVAERYLARTGYRPAKRWELDSNEAIKRSVGAGLGIAFVSRLVVEDELGRGELVPFQVEGTEPMRRAVQLLRPDGRELTPSERAFVATLCSCCDAQVAGCTAKSAETAGT